MFRILVVFFGNGPYARVAIWTRTNVAVRFLNHELTSRWAARADWAEGVGNPTWGWGLAGSFVARARSGQTGLALVDSGPVPGRDLAGTFVRYSMPLAVAGAMLAPGEAGVILVRQLKTWGLLLGGLFLGTVLGTVLTYVTVIMPRQRELGRLGDASGVLIGLPLESVVAPLVPGRTVVFEEVSSERFPNGKRAWLRTSRARIPIPLDEQAAFMNAFQNAVVTTLRTRGAATGSVSSQTESRPWGRVLIDRTGYTTPSGSPGWVQTWGVGEAGELVIWVTIQER
jgi:hypothetical protein